MSDAESGSVKTAGRTLDVFEAFAETGEPMTLTEIADRIGAPLSSCHALIRTLQARGYVYQFERRRWIYPTKRLYEIGNAITEHDPILVRMLPLLTELKDRTRETIILGKRSGDEVIYLEVIEGTQTIRYSAKPGERKPLHSSAAGKTLLSFLGEKEFDATIRRIGLPRMTSNTIVDEDAFRENIRAGREQGYFATRGENVVDVMAISLPLIIAGEKFALTVAGPVSRLDPQTETILSEMKAATRKLLEIDGK